MPSISTHVFRLTPGQDLKKEIQQYVNGKGIKAGWISTCVGSLTSYAIRFANQPVPNKSTGNFEIIHLGGTVSKNGSHIHICLSDHTGTTIGGHLSEGCIIYSTAEIVLLSTDGMEFSREADDTSGWEELKVTIPKAGEKPPL